MLPLAADAGWELVQNFESDSCFSRKCRSWFTWDENSAAVSRNSAAVAVSSPEPVRYSKWKKVAKTGIGRAVDRKSLTDTFGCPAVALQVQSPRPCGLFLWLIPAACFLPGPDGFCRNSVQEVRGKLQRFADGRCCGPTAGVADFGCVCRGTTIEVRPAVDEAEQALPASCCQGKDGQSRFCQNRCQEFWRKQVSMIAESRGFADDECLGNGD